MPCVCMFAAAAAAAASEAYLGTEQMEPSNSGRRQSEHKHAATEQPRDCDSLCVCFCGTRQLLKVFGEDEHARSLRVSDGATAMDVCRMLVTTAAAGCSEREHWALMEVHPALGLGKRAHPA